MNSNQESLQKIDETRFYDDLFERLRNGEQSLEGEAPIDNDIFYENIIEQLQDNQEEIAKCAKSYLIDFFIYKSKPKHFIELFELIAKEDYLNEYLKDVRISRAFEAFLICAGNKIDTLNNERIKTILKTIGNYFVDNFNEIIENEFAIYILRSFILIIGNKNPFDTNNKELSSSNIKKKQKEQLSFNLKSVNKLKELPDDWKLKKFLKKFYELLDKDKILEMTLINYKSPMIILFMHNLNSIYPELSEELIKSIHKKMKIKENSFHSMIQDVVGSRFIEAFLCLCNSKIREHYFEKFLLPNISAYSVHLYANYVLQSLLRSLNDDTQLKNLYEILLSQVDKLLNFNADHLFKHHLLIQLIETCKIKQYNSQDLIKVLNEHFRCSKEENQLYLIRLILIGKNYEEALKESSIKEALFYFEMKPIASIVATKLIELDQKCLLDGFRDLTPNELEHFCTDNIGSHFIEECINFFEKTKKTNIFNELLDKLKGRFLILACNKSGSFVIEHVWKCASLKQRTDICEELKLNENQLKNDRFARFFYNKIGLNFYKRKPEEWKKIQSQEIKKRNLFSEILDDDTSEFNGKRKALEECDNDKKSKKKKKWFYASNKN